MPPLRPHYPALWPAAIFAASLAVLLGATVLVVDTVPPVRTAAAAVLEAEGSRDADHYLANDVGGQVDHHVLFFGLDEVANAHLRAADVLFLGNSRLMFALRPAVLGPEFAAFGLSYYALGFGFREADRFPLAIIRKFDLRPRLVVVSADGFFGGGLSAWAEVVNRDTPFAARKLRWEAETAHQVRRAVHIVAPNWLTLFGRPGLGRARGFNAYRSRSNGTWEMSPWPDATTPFRPPSLRVAPPGRGELAGARAFKAEMDARGIALVLTQVPSPEPMPGARAASFAELLGVPLIVAEPPGLTSADHSHLDRSSANDWSREFMALLAPHLRDLAGAPHR